MFGEITNNSGELGGWELIGESAIPRTDRDDEGNEVTIKSLPQDLASAIVIVAEANNETLIPLFYVAKQIVNGVNHMLVNRRIKNGKIDIVRSIINIPAGSVGGVGATLVNELTPEQVTFSTEGQEVMKCIAKTFPSFTVSPLVEVGSQIVKGINYHVIIVRNFGNTTNDPQAFYDVVNQFQDKWEFQEDICLG